MDGKRRNNDRTSKETDTTELWENVLRTNY